MGIKECGARHICDDAADKGHKRSAEFRICDFTTASDAGRFAAASWRAILMRVGREPACLY